MLAYACVWPGPCVKPAPRADSRCRFQTCRRTASTARKRPLADHRLHREGHTKDERDPQRASGHNLAGAALGLQKADAHETEREQVEGDRAERHRGDRLPAGGAGDAEPARGQQKPDDAADKRKQAGHGNVPSMEKLPTARMIVPMNQEESQSQSTECAQIRIKYCFPYSFLAFVTVYPSGFAFNGNTGMRDRSTARVAATRRPEEGSRRPCSSSRP